MEKVQNVGIKSAFRPFFFNNYSINKIQIFVFLFFGGFLTLSPCGFNIIFQKQMCFVSYFLEVNVFCFLTPSHFAT